MRKGTMLAMVSLLLVSSASMATVQDTVRIGDRYAFCYGDGVFKVPVYYFNDNDTIIGMNFPFRFICTGGPISPDSITRAGRTAGTDIFNLFIGFSDSGGGNPDSTCAGFIGFTGGLPIGSGHMADMWFSGAEAGDFLTFSPIDFYPTGCETFSSPVDPDGGLIHVTTNLIVVGAGLEIVCSPNYTVDATSRLTFPVSVTGLYPPYSLVIDTMYGPGMQIPQPNLTGNDPWEFSWRPGFYDVGLYTLTLRATDSDNNTVLKNVYIDVNAIPEDPCQVMIGDMNCDGQIDIADLLFMVDWMFNGGDPPNCGSGK